MSRRTLATIVLAVAFALLAMGLFVAGAMWRARVTSVAVQSRSSYENH